MAIKTYKNYKRKTKLCKTRSDLFFKLPKKFYLRSFLRHFLQYFLQRFNVKFKVLNKNYAIYALNIFLKKVVYLLLKWNRRVLQTRNKMSIKFLAFYFFWQRFLSRFFDIFLRKDFGSGFFSVETKLQRKLFKELVYNYARRKKKKYTLRKLLIKQHEKAKVFNYFVHDRIRYLMNSFNFSKRLHKRKQSNFNEREKSLKHIYSNRRRYKEQKKNITFKWLVLENKTGLKRKAIYFNLKKTETSITSKMKSYIRYALQSKRVNFSTIETGLNLFIRNKKDAMTLATNVSHLIVLKVTTTNIYLTILSCRLVTVAKFSIGLAGFIKKKIKKQNYVLKKINGILICFLLKYICKWRTKFGVMPRFRVIIRSGFINKRLKLLLNSFFYFVKKRKGIIRSSLYFKRKQIRAFSKNYIKRFKRKYRFFNFGLTHNTLDTDLNKFRYNKQRFNIKFAANRYINFIKLTGSFNKLIYYFHKRSKWLQFIKRKSLNESTKKAINFKPKFRTKWPNLRTFDAKRSQCWTNLNLFFYLHFKNNRYSIMTNYRKIKLKSMLNLRENDAEKQKNVRLESQLPPVKMWYDFSQEMWNSVVKNQLIINKRNK